VASTAPAAAPQPRSNQATNPGSRKPVQKGSDGWGSPGLDEERNLQLADRYFGAQKVAEASGGDTSAASRSSSSSRAGGDAKSKRSARDAPPYPERGGGGMLDMVREHALRELSRQLVLWL
jgi:hypothetical protein